jgi:alpha-galactosidase
MWCMLAAPLIAGNDLRKMSQVTKELLTNKELIAVNQDARGIQAYKYSAKDSLEVWIKPLKNNELAVCFLNRSSNAKKINFSWKKHTFNDDFSKTHVDFSASDYKVRNLWTEKEIGKTNKDFDQEIPGHDVIMLKLIK